MLSEGFEPPTTASKAAMISISPRERKAIVSLKAAKLKTSARIERMPLFKEHIPKEVLHVTETLETAGLIIRFLLVVEK